MRRSPLRFFLACALLLCASTVSAQVVRTVANCNDSGAGSLRAAAAAAGEGDLIDMRGLTCGTIFLTTGAIVLHANNLSLQGPGYSRLTVNARARSQAFRQDVPANDPNNPRVEANLIFRSFTISWGRNIAANALGGCIYSQSRLYLFQMQVHHCVVGGTGALQTGGSGGAAFGWNNVTVSGSIIHTNRAAPDGDSGGVFSGGELRLESSRITNNYASTTAGGTTSLQGLRMYLSTVDHNIADTGSAGGVAVAGVTWINKSTIAWNHAAYRGAAEFDNTNTTRIIESTISHNSADESEAGFALGGNQQIAELISSTVVFNVAAAPGSHGCAQGAGVAVDGGVTIDNTIIAGNTCNGAPSDLGEDSNNGTSIAGGHDLIGHSDIPVPPDTIFANDPRLGALASNGGPTQTHAVLADSPALDAGANASGFQFDQRGNGFPRVKGAAADIGAFER